MKIIGILVVCCIALGNSALAQNQAEIDAAMRSYEQAKARSEEFLARPSVTRSFREAAESGDAASQWSLGSQYETGQGFPQNYVRAYVWYSVAAAQGGDFREVAASARDAVGAKLSASDLVTAQALATKCFESSFKDCD